MWHLVFPEATIAGTAVVPAIAGAVVPLEVIEEEEVDQER